MNKSHVTSDILSSSDYMGKLTEFSQPFIDVVDTIFVNVVTIVAFLIIIMALFKNVLAGAYCAYPKFWDKVHQAHVGQDGKGESWMGHLKKTFNKDIGAESIGTLIMAMLPDLKSMTDFEEGTHSAKHYFMKAMPQMIVCICIGAFIYNGQYRDTAQMVVDFGTTMVGRVLTNSDPVAVWDDLVQSSGRPDFSHDNAVTYKDRLQNDISIAIYSEIVRTYTDVTVMENKQKLASSIETVVGTWYTNNIATAETLEGFDDGRWDWSVTVSKGVGPVYGATNLQKGDGGQLIQCTTEWPIQNTFTFDSLQNTDRDMYVRLTIVFKQVNVQNSAKGLDVTLVVPAGRLYDGSTYVNSTDKLRFSGTATMTEVATKHPTSGAADTCDITLKVEGDNLIVSASGKTYEHLVNSGQTFQVSNGMRVRDSAMGLNVYHKVVSIEVVNGNGTAPIKIKYGGQMFALDQTLKDVKVEDTAGTTSTT